MKIYLAASYVRRLEMLGYKQLLEEDGYIVTSEWVTGIHEQTPWTETTYAQHDLQCIREADIFMGFTEPENVNSKYKRGGRHVEFGYAVAYGKRLVIVGPLENAFYHLLNVIQFSDFAKARTYLRSEAR